MLQFLSMGGHEVSNVVKGFALLVLIEKLKIVDYCSEVLEKHNSIELFIDADFILSVADLQKLFGVSLAEVEGFSCEHVEKV